MLIGIVLIIDSVTKIIISKKMLVGDSVTLIPKLLDITYVQNKGAAWGIFSNNPMLLTCFIIILLIALVIYLIKANPKALERYSLHLIIAGGLGNIISRIQYGFVVDFLNIHIIPVFNIADISICIGCGLLLLAVLFFDKND